jgi:SAM-dependent methyltransferase
VSLNDPELVRVQYESEDRLAARQAAYTTYEGVDAVDLVVHAVAEVRPRLVLEVGGGGGELGARLVRELGIELVEVDQSERMVELMRGRGLDARVGDAQSVPFGDGSFDCVVAAWMLYHVADVAKTLAELARVLRDGGRLVATTPGGDHMRELWDLVGVEFGDERRPFSAENGAALLAPAFAVVEERHARGTVELDRDSAYRYVTSGLLPGLEPSLPDDGWPRRITAHSVVFVATTADGV